VNSLPQPAVDGVVWGFHYAPGAPPRPIATLARPSDGWVWLHFDLVHTQSPRVIAACPDLPAFAKDVLTGHDEALRLLSEGDVIAGVLPGFHRRQEEGVDLVTWRFALLRDMLVTTRRAPVRGLITAWQAALAGHAPVAPQVLVDEAVGGFALEMRRNVAELAHELDGVEDVLLSLRRDRDRDLGLLGTTIGRVRREATKLKRALNPVVRLMDDDVDELPEWAVSWTHDAAHRQTHAAMDDLQAVQDRARALQDELSVEQANETNRRLYIVSVVTTLILPATFVTGFFGMNTGGMLFAEPGWGTIGGGLLCVAVLSAKWMAMRWKKLI
jgi:zinc transporter